jgi:hypothetical protein
MTSRDYPFFAVVALVIGVRAAELALRPCRRLKRTDIGAKNGGGIDRHRRLARIFSSERFPRTTAQPERIACGKFIRIIGVSRVTSQVRLESNTVPPSSRPSPSMASKPPVVSPGSSGSLALAQHPPSIDLSNKVLSSAIPLPLDASVVYAAFSPTTSPTLHADTVELARRRIIDIGKPSLLDSLLCTVYVEKGTQQLYVFSIISSDAMSDPFHSLRSLHFDGLICESFCLQFPSAFSILRFLFWGRSAICCVVCRALLTVSPVQHHKYHLSVLPKSTITSQRSQQEIGHLLPSITYRAHIQSTHTLPYSQ